MIFTSEYIEQKKKDNSTLIKAVEVQAKMVESGHQWMIYGRDIKLVRPENFQLNLSNGWRFSNSTIPVTN